jgi:hypothetical protein
LGYLPYKKVQVLIGDSLCITDFEPEQNREREKKREREREKKRERERD